MIEKIILASSSPRRKEIFNMLSIDFDIIIPTCDENISENYKNADYVIETSKLKALDVLDKIKSSLDYDVSKTLIVACDTMVCIDDLKIGKPKDESDARKILKKLSGKEHYVFTGLTLILGEKIVTNYAASKVYMSAYSDDVINKYISTGEPFDKAGGYGIQGLGSLLVEKIEGEYHNVIGFPIYTFTKLLKNEFGVDVFDIRKK